MGTVVLDTSVLLGLLDRNDVHHQTATATVRDVRRRGQRVLIPATVFGEVLVGAARVGGDAVSTTEAFLETVGDEIVAVDRAIARAAAYLRAARRAIRLPDALVIATGQVRAADEIHTADKQWREIDPRVRVLGR